MTKGDPTRGCREETHDAATCHYCRGQIILRHLGGYGDFWLLAGGNAPYEGRGVCPAREDGGHSPVKEDEDEVCLPPGPDGGAGQETITLSTARREHE